MNSILVLIYFGINIYLAGVQHGDLFAARRDTVDFIGKLLFSIAIVLFGVFIFCFFLIKFFIQSRKQIRAKKKMYAAKFTIEKGGLK